MFFRIITKKEKKTIAEKAIFADTFLKRFKGLMFDKKMEGYDALVIKPCKSIHTCFMKYSIDVVFLNEKFQIVKIKRNMRPWKMTPFYFSSTQVVEFENGRIDQELKEGDELELICIN